MHNENDMPELLVPASNLEVLKIAVIYGADAVYIGGEAFSLRAKAHNFSNAEMREGIRFAHERGVKVYVTVNIIAHNEDLQALDSYLLELQDIKPDALLVADPGVFMRCRKLCPQIPIHVSTQANNVNWETFLFWHSLGAERVVCGRELSLTAPCVSLIPEGVCYPVFWQAGMQTEESVPTLADGSTRLWRKHGRGSTCRYMRMNGEPTSSTRRISAWLSIFRI